MSLLGNGEDSSLTSNTGWGMMPPINSGADWGTTTASSSSTSSSIGANNNNSGNNHSSNSNISNNNNNNANCWQTNSGQQSRSLVSTSVSTNEQALSSSPKLSSSWAQAAGKGLLASGSQNQSASSGNTNSHQANNVIIQSSSSLSSTINANNSNHIGSVSSSSSGPNPTSMSIGTQNNQFSHDSSYSMAIHNNGGSNNSNLQNGTTGSNSAFQQAANLQNNNSSNNNSSSVASSSSNENLSSNGNMGGKRAIATASIQDVIGNLSDEIRETLLTEKWRSPVINQDSPWNLPPSPQSSSPKDTSQWRCPVNSGTEIWEAIKKEKKNGNGNGQSIINNQNGIQSNTPGVIHGGPQMNGPTATAPGSTGSVSTQLAWGQTAGATSIGGNWGEEDPDLTNHWVSNPVTNGGNGNNVGHSSSINWSPTNGPILPNQNTNQTPSFDSGANPGGWNQASDNSNSSKNVPRKPWGSFDNGDQSDPNWDRIASDNSFGTWNSEPKKDTAWDKESIDSQRGPFDDGTALWNSNVRQGKQPICNWKDTKFGGNSTISNNNNKNGSNGWNKSTMNVNPTNGGASIIGSVTNGVNNNNHPMMQQKSNQQMTNRSTPWAADTNQQRKSPLWNTIETAADSSAKVNGQTSSWLSDSPSSSSLFWPTNDINKPNNNKTGPAGAGSLTGGTLPPGPSNWMDSSATIDAGHWTATSTPLLQNRVVDSNGNGGLINSQKLSREIQSTTQFKTLQNMGFKKEEIENALRNNQMRFEEALKELNDDMNRRALTNDNRNMRSNIFHAQQTVTIPGSNGGGINQNTQNASNVNISAFPNRQMVELIRLAINAGFLNPQILNQPLSQHNLEILNELLSQLKLLRNIQPSRDPASQIKIQNIKQTIGNLQNQIQGHNTTSTSPFMMMSPNSSGRVPGMPPAPTPPNMDFFAKQNTQNPNPNEIGFDSFVQGATHGGSKLGTWKNPYKQDDRSSNTNDFVRAPGPLSKQNSHTSNTGNWGTNFSAAEEVTWGTEKTSNDLAAPLTGIVDYDVTNSLSDRFDGYYSNKPWKSGSKSAVDIDVTAVSSLDSRSPNSLLNTFSQKDPFSWSSTTSTAGGSSTTNPKPGLLNTQTDSFGGAFSNPATHNSTWAYNPMPGSFGSGEKTAATQHTSGGNGINQKKSGWLNSNAPEYNLNPDSLWSNHVSGGDNQTNSVQPNVNKPRPPPGLSGKMNQQNHGSSNSGNVWNSRLSANSPSGASEYLRLRNLTAQIDGSTLKTLCLQHGPLSLFHMILNHGVAIVRYSHRDQAIKAQSALNNCVLGNTTIIADFPTDNEIQQYLTLGGVTTTANQLSNSLAASVATWSNGTNASHTVVTAGCGGPQQIQSYQTNSVSAAAQRGVGVNVVQTSSSSSYGNNAASSSQTNHQNLPYGAGATHSSHASTPNSLPYGHHHHNQFNGNSKLNTEHNISGGWNTAPVVGNHAIMSSWSDVNTGSNSALGLGPNTSLWSTGGFGAVTSNQSGTNDRQTPTIQSFLPNDLLAGENN